MGITEIYANATGPILSYEFFPPKTDAGYRSLFRTIEELKKLDPGFVSVTMGAGGTTREKTVDLTSLSASSRGVGARTGSRSTSSICPSSTGIEHPNSFSSASISARTSTSPGTG